MVLTKETIQQLDDISLMKALSVYCGICTESQLTRLYESMQVDVERTFVRYNFAEIRDGNCVLNFKGLICAEVIDRFMPNNH